jgi:hypothetical protein
MLCLCYALVLTLTLYFALIVEERAQLSRKRSGDCCDELGCTQERGSINSSVFGVNRASWIWCASWLVAAFVQRLLKLLSHFLLGVNTASHFYVSWNFWLGFPTKLDSDNRAGLMLWKSGLNRYQGARSRKTVIMTDVWQCLKLILALIRMNLLSCLNLRPLYLFIPTLKNQLLRLAYLPHLAIVVKQSREAVIALKSGFHEILIYKFLLPFNVIVVLLGWEPFLNCTE